MFCSPCYDHGKSEEPEDCLRCRVIAAHARAKQGDLRKVRPGIKPAATVQTDTAGASVVALFLAGLLLFCALVMASEANHRADLLQKELLTCRKAK